MNKTIKKLNDFFDEITNDKKMKLHSECVLESCMKLSENKNLDLDIFEIASFIHDLGKKESDEFHEYRSLKYLFMFFDKHPKENNREEIVRVIIDCIINHRTNGDPKTEYAKIFKIADKDALNNTKWKVFKLKI